VIHPTSLRCASLPRVVVALCLAVAAFALGGCAQDPDPKSATGASVEEAARPRSAPPSDLSVFRALPEVPPPPAPTVSCGYIPDGTADGPLPPPSASTVGTVEVVLDTSVGPVPLVLERAQAPCAVNSFVHLARRGFYDGVACHRLSTDPGGELYQCGDPTGTGTGGPGYTFADEYPVTQFAAETAQGYVPPAVTYPRGTVAMANAGVRDSNGSQFFLLLGDSLLRQDFTAFGRITGDGLPVLEAAAADGHDDSSPLGGGIPNTPVVIQDVR